MSEQNVEVVRRFFDAIERSLNAWDRSRSFVEAIRTGDLPPETRAVLEYMSPEMEWRPAFSTETYRGYAEIARAWDEFLDAFTNYNLELLEAIDLGDDRVFVTWGPTLEGRSSGIHVSAAVFGVVMVEDGRVVRVEEYSNRRDALEAAGKPAQ
jgi:ketosteroid isomerase-like protein